MARNQSAIMAEASELDAPLTKPTLKKKATQMNNKLKGLQGDLKEARGVLKEVKTVSKGANTSLRTMVKEHNALQKPFAAAARVADRTTKTKQGIVDRLIVKIDAEKAKQSA